MSNSCSESELAFVACVCLPLGTGRDNIIIHQVLFSALKHDTTVTGPRIICGRMDFADPVVGCEIGGHSAGDQNDFEDWEKEMDTCAQGELIRCCQISTSRLGM